MGSRDKDQTTPHPPLLSSLVVRLSARDSTAGGGGGGGGAGRGRSDYEPGEVRREPHSRSGRHSGDSGHRLRAGSTSPVRKKDAGRHYNSDIDRSRSREVGGSRNSGRFRGSSPTRARERDGGRPFGRGPERGSLPLRGEAINRHNPNVRPRDGDWYCPYPLCGNLNFARRDHCNTCKRSRHALAGSPRRGGYPVPTDALPKRYPGPPPPDHSPGRHINGFRSPPPRALLRDGPREFGLDRILLLPPPPPPPLRHFDDVRFADHHFRRDPLNFPEDHYRGRARFDDRPPSPLDWAHRDRVREIFFGERKPPFEKLPLVPLPLPPPHHRWGHDVVRERSRSPIRGGPLLKDYRRRDSYVDRGRDHDRRGMGRDRDRDRAYR